MVTRKNKTGNTDNTIDPVATDPTPEFVPEAPLSADVPEVDPFAGPPAAGSSRRD